MKKRNDISIKEIIRMYFEEKMSTPDIAKKFNVSIAFIQFRIINAGYKLRNLSESHQVKPCKAWNKGLTKETDERVMNISKTSKEIYSSGKKKKLIGEENPFYGKKHTEETIKKVRDARAKQVFEFYNSSIELKIQAFLKMLKIEYYVHFAVDDIEHSYNCDILIPSTKTVIECDGDYFHGNPIIFKLEDLNKKQIEQKERDNLRNIELKEKGYTVIRLWESEIKAMTLGDFQLIMKKPQTEAQAS